MISVATRSEAGYRARVAHGEWVVLYWARRSGATGLDESDAPIHKEPCAPAGLSGLPASRSGPGLPRCSRCAPDPPAGARRPRPAPHAPAMPYLVVEHDLLRAAPGEAHAGSALGPRRSSVWRTRCIVVEVLGTRDGTRMQLEALLVEAQPVRRSDARRGSSTRCRTDAGRTVAMPARRAGRRGLPPARRRARDR